jgi:hypothetical protein
MQKWSDHAPVFMDLRDMPEHDPERVPEPCGLSSRAVPKNGLKSLFQRSKQTATLQVRLQYLAAMRLVIWRAVRLRLAGHGAVSRF